MWLEKVIQKLKHKPEGETQLKPEEETQENPISVEDPEQMSDAMKKLIVYAVIGRNWKDIHTPQGEGESRKSS